MRKCILLLIFTLPSICFSQTMQVWSVNHNKARVFDDLNYEKIVSGNVANIEKIRGYDDDLIKSMSKLNSVEIDDDSYIVIGFRKGDSLFTLVDAGVSDTTDVLFTNYDSKGSIDSYRNEKDKLGGYFIIMPVVDFKNLMKSELGTYVKISLTVSGNNLYRVVRYFVKTEPYGIKIIGGFGLWAPIGLVSLTKKDGKYLTGISPLGAGIGIKYRLEKGVNDYLGFSAFANYTTTETGEDKFVNSVNVGLLMDVYNLFYVGGYLTPLAVDESMKSKVGLLFGISPELLNRLK